MVVQKRMYRFAVCAVFTSITLVYIPSGLSKAPEEKKQVRVYIDMVGDLFHAGHVNAIKNARTFGDYLIVGLCGDNDCASYKRRPILNIDERVMAAKACEFVDEVIPNAPMKATKEFIAKHNIDIIVHGDDFDKEKMQKYYGDAIELGILRIVPYTPGISTSEIIQRILSRAEELSTKIHKSVKS